MGKEKLQSEAIQTLKAYMNDYNKSVSKLKKFEENKEFSSIITRLEKPKPLPKESLLFEERMNEDYHILKYFVQSDGLLNRFFDDGRQIEDFEKIELFALPSTYVSKEGIRSVVETWVLQREE